MIRPPLEVADIVRTYGTAFLKQHRRWLTALHLKVLRAIVACRTAALGGHLEQCDSCGQRAISYNSCLNRHCQSAKPQHGRLGWRNVPPNCCPYPTIMSSSPCPTSWLPWPCRTKLSFMACCFELQPRPYCRSPLIPSTWALRSAFWQFSILGVRHSCRTLIHNAWHYHLLGFQETTQVDFPCDPLRGGACLSGAGVRVCCAPALFPDRTDEFPKEHAERLVHGSIGRPRPAVRWNGDSRRIAELLHSS